MTDKTNSKLKTYISTLASALILSAIFAYTLGAFSQPHISLVFAGLSDACFITAVLYIGFGALVWISLSGFFDALAYGFKSLKYLFTLIKKDPDEGGYYEYVMAKREKRKGKTPPYFVLVIGLIILALAVIFLVLWSVTGAVELPVA